MAKIYFKTLIFILNPLLTAMPAWYNDVVYTRVAADLFATVKRFEQSKCKTFSHFFFFFHILLMCFSDDVFVPIGVVPAGVK